MNRDEQTDHKADVQPVRGPQKGRGTVWAIEHRFSANERTSFDDGWGSQAQAALEEQVAPCTTVIEQNVKTILAGNDSPDIGFDLSINPYRGCEHVMWNSLEGLRLTVSPRHRLPNFFGPIDMLGVDLVFTQWRMSLINIDKSRTL